MTTAAAVATNRPAYPQSAETAAALGWLAVLGLFRWIAAAQARARTRRILRSLDDYALRDIGLTRSQIESIDQDSRYSPRFARF